MVESSTTEQKARIVDASVLINYLGLGRLDLLSRLSRRILITPEVNQQIPRNRAALDAALDAGQVEIASPLLGERDAGIFAGLARRLGTADASCIVAAKTLEAGLAADDETLLRLAASVLAEGTLLGTEDLLAEAVTAGLISLEEGDALLAQLPTIRYRPKVASLRELLRDGERGPESV